MYQSLDGISVFHCKLQLSASCSAAISGLPIFYQALIQLWCKICDTEPPQPCEILGQSVWNNRFILCKRDPIFYNEFCSKGIRTVYDLMCQDHKFLDWRAAQQKIWSRKKRRDEMVWYNKSHTKHMEKKLLRMNW